MMVIETANKIKVFIVRGQETKHEPKYSSTNLLASKANLEKELAKHDQEAQALVNQILDMVENG